MKPLFILPDDYIAASLHRLEETRGHILSEDEYRALRQETLNELATFARRPETFASALGAVVCAVAAGALALFVQNADPILVAGLAAGAMGCATSFAAQFRRTTTPAWTTEQRLTTLKSLREYQLVTDDEFSRLSERIELPRAA